MIQGLGQPKDWANRQRIERNSDANSPNSDKTSKPANPAELESYRARKIIAKTDQEIADNADRLKHENQRLQMHFDQKRRSDHSREILRQQKAKSLFGVKKEITRDTSTGNIVQIGKQVDTERRITMASSVQVVRQSDDIRKKGWGGSTPSDGFVITD